MAQKLNIPALRACGKLRFYNRRIAELEKECLSIQQRRNRPTGHALRVYFCTVCDAYHIGHTC